MIEYGIWFGLCSIRENISSHSCPFFLHISSPSNYIEHMINNIVSSLNSSHQESTSSFSKSLFKNSNILRIVLRRPIQNVIHYDTWQRIDLMLVTEMGLPVKDKDAIRLSCTLIRKNNLGLWSQYPIESRPISEDAWEPEVNLCEGFNSGSSVGGIEYTVQPEQASSDKCFISLQLAHSHSVKLLPLTVGPITFLHQQQAMMTVIDEGIVDQHQHQQYRSLQLSLKHGYFLLKEQWDYGTPGKLWDSALMITDIFVSIYTTNPHFLAKKRILDLSAGTGYIGLSISKLYQLQSDTDESPHIILTDIREALGLIEINKNLNQIRSTPQLTIAPLNWGCLRDARRILSDGPLDYIIASDILYNIKDFQSILLTFRQLSSENTVIYFGYKPRGLTQSDETKFFDACKKYFKVTLLQYQDVQREFKIVYDNSGYINGKKAGIFNFSSYC
ncbi:putative methyltransferase-domain-containing protein [Pilobolus umbonatus]|nr:putative methyltransferase-domain-containing protein [Pilobolus umbonatus]